MTFSVVHFLVLLLGAAVAIPPPGRYNDESWGRKAAPGYFGESVDVKDAPLGREAVAPGYLSESVDDMCTGKIANTLKLAIVYTEFSAIIQPLHTILHDVYLEPELADEVASLLSSTRQLQPRYLLDSTYNHRVPMLLWTMSELTPVFMEKTPSTRMLAKFNRKLSEDCSILFTAQDMTALLDFLTKAESTIIAQVNGLIRRLPTTSDVTTHLMSRIDVLTTAMSWARHMLMSDTTPSHIITYWKTRRPLLEAAGSKEAAASSKKSSKSLESAEAARSSKESSESKESESKESESKESSESMESHESKASRSRESNAIRRDDTIIPVLMSSPTQVRCYRQKMDVYKLLLVNYLVDMDTMALKNIMAKTLASHELTVTPDAMSFLRKQQPIIFNKMLRTVQVKLADIFMQPSVAAVVKANILTNLKLALTKQTLQTAVAAIMASDKLCRVDANHLTHNLTAILNQLQEHMRISKIKAALKQDLSQHLAPNTMDKLCSGFESRYMPISDLHTKLVHSLSANQEMPPPETLITSFNVFISSCKAPSLHSHGRVHPETTESDTVLVSSLRRVGVDPATPMLLVPGPLLLEVIMNVATSLTPTSLPCARLAALKLATAFSKTTIIQELSYGKRFIALFTEKSLQSHIPHEQLQLFVEEIRKVILKKIETTFTDKDIETAEGIFKDILTLEYATFEKPVPAVLSPLIEKMKTLLTTLKCTENVDDLRQKTLVAIIHSLKTPIATSEIETMVKKTFKTTAEQTEVVALLNNVLPEVTGGLLEEVELITAYTMHVQDLHVNFPVIFSDCIVRVLSEVSPVPLMHEMAAILPQDSPMAIVMQPRARRVIHHMTEQLFKSVKAAGVELPKAELDSITETVMAKISKLGSKSPEPSNKSFKPSKMSYDVAERTLSVLGDIAQEEASPSVIRHVISMTMKELEAELRPECLNAARVQLMAGVFRVLLERHVLMSTAESGLFVTVYKVLRPDIHNLNDIQKVTSALSAALRTKVTHAMTGLSMMTDTRTEELVRELFKLPYERLSGLTLKELLVQPLSNIKTFYKDFTTCTFDMNTFTKEMDTFSERWAKMALTKADLTQMLTPVLSDRVVLAKVCTKLCTVAFPEVHHHVATTFMYTKNAITASSPAVFRRFFGRIMISTFGLTSPAPLRGFLEQPLFDVFTTELYTELTHKLTELKVTHQEVKRLLNDAFIHSMEECTDSTHTHGKPAPAHEKPTHEKPTPIPTHGRHFQQL